MKLRLFLLVGAAALVFACSTMRTNVDWDGTADFARYRTFGFGKGSPARNDFSQREVERLVAAKLQSKGLAFTEGRPDLRVVLHFVYRRAQRIDTVYYGYGWRWGGGVAATYVTNVPVGTLLVDLVDTERKELVWRGRATDTVAADREERREKLQEAVDRLFAEFPPPRGAR